LQHLLGGIVIDYITETAATQCELQMVNDKGKTGRGLFLNGGKNRPLRPSFGDCHPSFFSKL